MAGLRPLKAWPPSLGVQSTLDGKKNILETAGVVYPRKTDRDRPWLPYHPPERSARSIESARMIYEDNGFPNLSIPIRTVNLLAGDSITCARHALHLYIHEGDGPDTKPTNERFLFHGCSTAASPALLQSFAKMGPSIYFSRPKSYLSRGPAVYWTDSFEFALAWCVFTKTGKWMANEPYQSRDFECLIYVSKVNINDLSSRFDTHLINTPSSIEEEQNLVDVCYQLVFPNLKTNLGSFALQTWIKMRPAQGLNLLGLTKLGGVF